MMILKMATAAFLKHEFETLPLGDEAMICRYSMIPAFWCFCGSCNKFRAELKANPFSEN